MPIVRPILLFFFFFLIKGCTSNQDHNTIQDLLIGDWKRDVSDSIPHKYAYRFSFEDSTCSVNYLSYSMTYEIRGDSIVAYSKDIMRSHGNREITVPNIFIIDSLSSTNLWLIPRHEPEQYRGQYNRFDSSMIRLTKLKNINNITFTHLSFKSTVCFGSCPAMELEIDSTGKMIFYGKLNCDSIGFFSSQLPKRILHQLKREISYVPFDTLESFYRSDWTDLPTNYVLVETTDTIYKTGVYGSTTEPIEIRFLFSFLKNIYRQVKLNRIKFDRELLKHDGFWVDLEYSDFHKRRLESS